MHRKMHDSLLRHNFTFIIDSMRNRVCIFAKKTKSYYDDKYIKLCRKVIISIKDNFVNIYKNDIQEEAHAK